MVTTKQRFASGILLFTVILMDVLSGMELDLFVPSFPELQMQFALSAFEVEALLSLNFIGYCLGFFGVGGLADRYGRKPMILIGLIIFIFGSLLCLGAPSYLFLLIGRFLQGLGIAAPAILSFLIVADVYPLQKQQSLLAILNGIINLSIGAAPVIGSYVTLHFHWKGNFSVLLGLGIVTFGMTLFCVPPSPRPSNPQTLSPRGYFPIFHVKPLRLLLGHIISQTVPYWIFVGIAPLLYIKTLGVSLVDFGYYQGSLAFLFAIGSLFSGLAINRFPTKTLLLFSAYIFLFGFVTLGWATLAKNPSPLEITLAFLPFVMGQIFPGAILFPLALNFLPHSKGKIAALIQGGRLIFSALGLQLAGYLYRGSFRETGLILLVFMGIAILTLFHILKEPELIKSSQQP